MESDSQSSNEDNCSSSDSCSDMDVANREENKEQRISKQEQIYRKILSYYSHNFQNIIMLLKYKTKCMTKNLLLRFRTGENALRIYVLNQCILDKILVNIELKRLWMESYKTRKILMFLRKTRTIFDHYKIFRKFTEDNRKSQSRSPRKIEDEHVKYILSEVDKNGSLSAKNLWPLIKSKFNIDVGGTRIVEILNSHEYKYRSPKLKWITTPLDKTGVKDI